MHMIGYHAPTVEGDRALCNAGIFEIAHQRLKGAEGL